MSHSHVCPVCKRTFQCVGLTCAPYEAVSHPACDPKSKLAARTVEITPPKRK